MKTIASPEETRALQKPERFATPALPLRRAWGALFVFYAVALMLNAASLHRNNQHMPYGPVRTFWVSVTEPLANASSALGLDRPRQFLYRTLGAALNP